MALLTRLGLMTETVLAFLKALRGEQPDQVAKLAPRQDKRCLCLSHTDHRQVYFADARKAEVPRRLGEVARDVHGLVERFRHASPVRSENGARVGDSFMSLIHTARLDGASPFDYLVAQLRHADQPDQWMPCTNAPRPSPPYLGRAERAAPDPPGVPGHRHGIARGSASSRC